MCMFCRSLFVLFLLPIVLSVLRFTDPDYPFGIFNLYLQQGQRISLLTDLSVDESQNGFNKMTTRPSTLWRSSLKQLILNRLTTWQRTTWLQKTLSTTCRNSFYKVIKRVWRYQRGNQNPYIEEEQTTQWPKEKVQKANNDLQNIYIKLKIE